MKKYIFQGDSQERDDAKSDKKIVFATTERSAEEARGWNQSQQQQRPSYMPTRGIAAVLNQGLHSLGEKLSKIKINSINRC